MELAKRCGLDAASSFIDVMEDGVALFVTKRYDRLAVPGSADEPAAEHVRVDRLHQEDFCQVLGKLPEHKYEEPGQCFPRMVRDAIFEHSEDPVGDVTAFAKLLMLNAVVGNCDGHLKNLSFVRSEDWARSRLAPVYDVASTVVYEKLDRHMGMRIGDAGKVDEVTRADFLKLADDLHLSKRAMGRMLDEVCQGVEASIDEVVLGMEDELCYKLPVLWDLAKFAKAQVKRLCR